MSEQDTPTAAPQPAPNPTPFEPRGAEPAPLERGAEPAPLERGAEPAPARSLEDRVAALERQLGVPAGAHAAVGRPTVSLGSADAAVTELTAKLNDLGYEVTVGPTVTQEVINVVNAFRRDHDVDDEVDSIPEGYSPDVRSRWIGPETWAAVLTA